MVLDAVVAQSETHGQCTWFRGEQHHKERDNDLYLSTWMFLSLLVNEQTYLPHIMNLLPILFCLAHLALSSPNLSKFNQPAALGAYKDIIDTASSSPVSVLGKTWKKFTYADYKLPAKPVRGAYQDIINAVENPKEVLGSRTFETNCELFVYLQQVGGS
jgi:hypothetical protein